jgi:drug/metabolite transporter (DMT)-like permease
MSYQEKNITVSLVSHLLIVVYYLVNLFQMQQAGGLVSTKVFSLWAIVIVAAIITTILGSILTNILLSIVHAIKTRSDREEQFIEDERDQLIGLKGSKVSYIAFSIGVLIAMLSFAFGQPPLVMFCLLILSSILGQIIGDLSQLYLYRKGF